MIAHIVVDKARPSRQLVVLGSRARGLGEQVTLADLDDGEYYKYNYNVFKERFSFFKLANENTSSNVKHQKVKGLLKL